MVLPGGSIAVCGDGVVGCDSVSVAAVDVSGGADGERWRRSLTEAEAAAADEAQRRADHPDNGPGGSRPPYRGKHRK